MRCRAPVASTIDAGGRTTLVTKPRGHPAQTALRSQTKEAQASGSCELFSSNLLPDLEGGKCSA